MLTRAEVVDEGREHGGWIVGRDVALAGQHARHIRAQQQQADRLDHAGARARRLGGEPRERVG